jgi:heme oxygenase
VIEADAPPLALDVLRERTRALHAQLEDAVDLDRALGSLAGYVELLRGYLKIYTAFEAELGRQKNLEGIVSQMYASKVPSLERDLRTLGVEMRSLGESAERIPLPPLNDLDSVLGALYVVEGSSLGGQIIYRQIQERLGIDAASGGSFFFGNGERTGAAWKRFMGILNQHISRPELAAEAAARMFGAFAYGLQPTRNDGPAL